MSFQGAMAPARGRDLVVRMAIVGGFLGSGKTTLINGIAKELKAQGKSVGLVMNDQGEALVDTQYCEANGFQVAEVLRGCFCCKFNDLITGTRGLVGRVKPDYVIAEPVGSCTDLQATVVAPLKSIYAKEISVAPLMVLVDSSRISEDEMLGESLGGYLRHHQIAEADVVVLSKTDMISTSRLREIVEEVGKINAEAEVIPYSSLDGSGFKQIMKVITSEREPTHRPVDIDYDKYAAAEAELGWYNGQFTLKADHLDTYDLATRILRELASKYHPQDVAHAKVSVRSPHNQAKISMVYSNLIVDSVLGSRYSAGETTVLLNARIVSSPEELSKNMRESVKYTLREMKLATVEIKDDCFAPGRPNPTYRMR